MVSENDLRKELEKRGYTCDINDFIKNGVTMRGLSIREEGSRINPVIYLDRLLDEFISSDEAASTIINVYESHKAFDLGIDPDELGNPEYIKDHVYIGLQKSSDEDIIHKDSIYEGIEEFLYLRSDKPESGKDRWSCKIKPGMVKDMVVEELWETARERTYEDFQITSLFDVIKSLGFTEDEEAPNITPPIYVISNTDNYRGAALACDIDSIKKWASEHNYHRIVICPSSIHEMLLIPLSEESYDLETFNSLVAEVNETQVAPEEQLTSRAYLIEI